MFYFYQQDKIIHFRVLLSASKITVMEHPVLAYGKLKADRNRIAWLYVKN